MGGQLLPIQACLIVATFRNPTTTISSAMDFEFDPKNSVLGHAQFEDLADRWASFLNSSSIHGSRIPFLNMFAEWLRFPNIFPIAFEEFADGDASMATQAVWDMQISLCIPGTPYDILETALGKSATYREGDIRERIVVPADIDKMITKKSHGFLSMVLGYRESNTGWWHEMRMRTALPVDGRPTGIDLTLDVTPTHVFFYRDGWVVARSHDISDEPTRLALKRLPYLQAQFASLEEAQLWAVAHAASSGRPRTIGERFHSGAFSFTTRLREFASRLTSRD